MRNSLASVLWTAVIAFFLNISGGALAQVPERQRPMGHPAA